MSQICTWCGTEYEPRNNGGKPQRFCSPDCRRDFFAACRAWAAREFEAGRVSVKDLQGASAQRARCYTGAAAPFRPPDGFGPPAGARTRLYGACNRAYPGGRMILTAKRTRLYRETYLQ